jgi:hypothetical protein
VAADEKHHAGSYPRDLQSVWTNPIERERERERERELFKEFKEF